MSESRESSVKEEVQAEPSIQVSKMLLEKEAVKPPVKPILGKKLGETSKYVSQHYHRN